jgi:hypothetical protein
MKRLRQQQSLAETVVAFSVAATGVQCPHAAQSSQGWNGHILSLASSSARHRLHAWNHHLPGALEVVAMAVEVPSAEDADKPFMMFIECHYSDLAVVAFLLKFGTVFGHSD